MKRTYLFLTLTFLTAVTVGCGYFMAGTWEDDPKNWKRAFSTSKPENVTVVHSRYWRSPHWTYEVTYYFELEPNVELKKQLFSENDLQELAPDSAGIPDSKPVWFAPKPLSQYEIWRYADQPVGNFRLLFDRKTGNMFLMDYQL